MDNQPQDEQKTQASSEGSSIPIGTLALVGFLIATISGLWLAMYALYLFRGGQA
ncbi:MAG: cytochrome c oxidase subunit 2A [Deinococcota bacterium]